MSRPLVFAHRGHTDGHLENTLAAFRAARQLGADGVELDVRRTADGALVVHHDADLPDGRPLAATRAQDLPDHVPLLAEALEACRPMTVNVEVKHDPATDGDRALAGAVASALVGGGWADQVLLSSFDADSLDVLRNAGLPVGWLQPSAADLHGAVAEAARRGYQAVHPFVARVDRALVDQAHGAGLAVNVWTVNAALDLATMVDLGVDLVITDRLVAALAAVGGGPPNGEAPVG